MNEIKIICETCKKELKGPRQYNSHYNKNHDIRVTGLLEFKINNKLNIECFKGIALEDAKAGETVRTRL